MTPFLSMILLWPCNFAPNGWAFCMGNILSIAQNTALFSLLGTTYGGDGISTFALPDFRGRVPVGAGQGPGLSPYVIGKVNGSETVNLITNQIPAHNHTASLTFTVSASNVQATNNVPAASNSLAAVYDIGNGNPIAGYIASAPNTPLNVGPGTATGTTALTGGNLPHNNMQPFLVVNYIIALQGVFPSRG